LIQKKASPIHSEKPPVSLLHLYKRGIYLYLTTRNNKPFIRFYYFDVLDDINGLKYKHDVAMIFEFLAYHEISVAFDIVLYVWADFKATLFERNFNITKSDLQKINHKDIRYNYKPLYFGNLQRQFFVSLGLSSKNNMSNIYRVSKFD